MVGYVKLNTDTWEDMYRRLKLRLEKIQEHIPISSWTGELNRRKDALHHRVTHTSSNCLVKSVREWSPKSINDLKLEV